MIIKHCPLKEHNAEFKRIGGSRPGWECQRCRIFYPEDTWELTADSLQRKYERVPRRRGYVDAVALRQSNRLTNVFAYSDSEVDRLEELDANNDYTC